VRVQDAFDRSWWERVSGGAASSLAEMPVDLGDKGSSTWVFEGVVQTIDMCLAESDPTTALKAHLRALPTPTATLSTLSTLTRLLLLYTAYSIGASHLVLGTSLTSLSISLISSISQGGGFVVPQAIQEEWIPPFVKSTPGAKSWNGEVRLIRPLRDVNMKECNAWVWWHQLSLVGKQSIPISERTIGNLTKGRLTVAPVMSLPDDSADFIIGLEKDYPSTVSTIAKTVGKLAPKGESGMRCVLCEL
jgi:cytoplasmic tRNA 2-thiolation protein 2